MIVICNLYVRRGRRGYDQLVAAINEGRIGQWAAPMYARYGRTIRREDYYRYDDDGVWVNLKDYQALVGMAHAPEKTQPAAS